jgi:hypothetical protein
MNYICIFKAFGVILLHFEIKCIRGSSKKKVSAGRRLVGGGRSCPAWTEPCMTLELTKYTIFNMINDIKQAPL